MSSILVALMDVQIAYAQDKSGEITYGTEAFLTSSDSLKTLQKSGSYRVVKVIDSLTFLLDNNDIVRLSGLDIPGRHLEDSPDYVHKAFEALRHDFEGQAVLLYQPPIAGRLGGPAPLVQSGRKNSKNKAHHTNRMGHRLGHIVRAKDQLWAQGVLLGRGYARLRTTRGHSQPILKLRHAQNVAIHHGYGLWGASDDNKERGNKEGYRILSPEMAGEYLHSYQIIEGKIASISSVRNVIYLNFGANWREDFTVSIPANLRQDVQNFLRSDPLQWQGKYLRVHGWIEDYNGPYVKIDHPERLELVDRNGDNQREKKKDLVQ